MTKSGRWYSSTTQIYWACAALLSGRWLSTRTEIREVRGWRLAAICHKLIKQYGWPIETEYRGAENIAHYRLTPGTDISRLKFPPSAKSLADGLEGGAQ
ncbi:hypothetical protein [Paracoccus sp. SCSIO 75233]|uniref:hypothetical protein n=1 Tax=Paracoccus sp. SCSIO 75233 TaxID=3017782 RepID=UPI0022F0A0C9|nr:hypothetical protein [Paracoccus sp. SCSIO 75233]WBU52068.1 hypothetical protein PAF12_09465 [Paracoccus sp. SCSIO 75233]